MATKKRAETKAKKAPADDLKIENFRRSMAVNLTRDEVAERADRAAQLLKERDQKEAEFKEQAGANKRIVARLENELREVSAEVRERKAYQDVPCERRYNWTRGTVTEVRLDTGEELSSRPMTDAEAQKALPFNPDAPGDVDDEFGGQGDEGDE